MKTCNNCHQKFNDPNWQCPHCDYQPEIIDNIPLLAPNLQSGFESHYFEPLSEHEKGHFWFESRNQIILWALKKYFDSMQSFLEVGCGTGFVLSGIKARRPELETFGSEIFIEGLTIAQKRLPDSQLIQMDAQSIPFEAEFDVIGTFDVLEHIEQDLSALQQMHKALKPNGGLVISVPQHPQLWSVVDEYGHHHRRYTRKELIDKVQQANFKVLHVTSFMTFTLPLLYLSRRATKNQTVEDYDASQELKLPTIINATLRNILRIENLLIRAGLSLPVGGSLLLIARRID